MKNENSEWKNTTSKYDKERGLELFSYGNNETWSDKLVIGVYSKSITPERKYTKGKAEDRGDEIVHKKIWKPQLPDYNAFIAREWIFDEGGSNMYDHPLHF